MTMATAVFTASVFFLLQTCCFLCQGRSPDWLVQKVTNPVTFAKTPKGTWILGNSLIYREFAVTPGFATVDFYSMEKEQSMLRAINPEAVIELDGTTYRVGGFNTSIQRAYLNRTALAQGMKADPASFQFVSFSTGKPTSRFPYTPRRGAPAEIVWPPHGLRLDVLFAAPSSAPEWHKAFKVYVHYEMYVGIPLLRKWVSIQSSEGWEADARVAIRSVEYLSVNDQWASDSSDSRHAVVDRGWLSVDTDAPNSAQVTWFRESSEASMPGSFEPALNCSYANPYTTVRMSKDGVESFGVHELVIGSSDRQRSALARLRMLRLLAPHTQENPIFFHMVKPDSASVREVLDQMAEVGFEMLIYSFGSGFDMESLNDTYVQSVAADIAYANKKGIEVGGYDLIAGTRQVPEPFWMSLDQEGKSTGSVCLASGWYDYLLERMLDFMKKTNLSMVETDGAYYGYTCASTDHKYHEGLHDSVYWMNKKQGDLFVELRKRAVYINQPANYFYQGGSRTGLGYNENQYSLPRWQDVSISRQSVYDDTYILTPTAGWMFAPFTVYHGGGAAAQFEPLTDHKTVYEWAFAQYLGGGTAACYRGYRLFDSNETKAIAQKWVSFYKTYRDIVTSDIIHLRRPDMQSIDSFMHVNPYIKNRALAMVYNPTLERQTMNLTLPLYYAGLTDTATVSQEGKSGRVYHLARDYSIDVYVDLMPLNITWFLVR